MRYVKLYIYAGQPFALLGTPQADGSWHAMAWDEGKWQPAWHYATAARLLGKRLETKDFLNLFPAAACAMRHALEQGTGERVTR